MWQGDHNTHLSKPWISIKFFIYYFAGVYEGSITELPNILNDWHWFTMVHQCKYAGVDWKRKIFLIYAIDHLRNEL